MTEDILEARTRLDSANEEAERAAEAWGEERSKERWSEYIRANKEADRAFEDLWGLEVHQALRDQRFA